MAKVTPELLQKLGLAPERLGAAEELPPPPATVGQGAVKEAFLSIAMLAAGAHAKLLNVSSPVFASAGVEVDSLEIQAGTVRLQDRFARPFTAEVVAGNAEAGVQSDDPATAWLQPRDGVIKVVHADGSGFLISAEGSRVSIQTIEAADLAMAPLAYWSPPLQPWLASVQEGWLRSSVAEEAGSAWGDAVASGLLFRHPPMTPGAQARVEEILAGGNPPVSPVVAWAQARPASELASVTRLALADVDALYAELESLEANPLWDDDDWWSDVLDLMVRREALQGVRDLFGALGASGPLDRALPPLDARGERFVRSLPAHRAVEHPWLWQAHVIEPDAWWASTARPTV